jgi:photosystem II stability/assembly factor-like uncharacterized protein
VYAGAASGVYRSNDRGASWTACYNGLENVIYDLALDPTNPSTLYAGTPEGVFRTDDRGSTWTSCSSGLPDQWVDAVVVDPTSPSIVYAAVVGNGVYRSDDRGVTWTSFSEGVTSADYWTFSITPATP